MAEGVLGIAGGGSAALNQDIIDKLKAADRKATVAPMEKRIEDWELESVSISAIKALNLELITSFKALSIDNPTNAFEQKTATTSGTSVNYDVDDVSALIEGTTNITVTQLAQRDVYQTAVFSDKTAQVDGGNDAGDKITIQIGSGAAIEFTTEGKTYEELATDISNNIGLNASVEQVGEGKFRLVIKSAESGIASALTITQEGVDLKIATTQISKSFSSTTSFLEETDSNIGNSKITINVNSTNYDINTHNKSLEDIRDDINSKNGLNDDILAEIVNGKLILNNKNAIEYNISVVEDNIELGFSSAVVQAQNLKTSIDGVAYNVSSNTITTQGSLKITANELGDSSITIRQDTSGVSKGAKDIVEKYNAMVLLVDMELNNPESTINDKSSLRMLKTSMKDILFGSYGANNDKNIFNFGFDLDKAGMLSVDETIFNTAVSTDLDSLQALFIGTAENKGLGTLLYTYTDGLDGFEGLLSNYDENMTARKATLDKDLENEIESLDAKYKLMAEEFAAYGSLIATMEAQFGSLKMMMEQSTSGN